MRRLLIWLPLLVFGAFLLVFVKGLVLPGDRVVVSRLVGQPLPRFTLPGGVSGQPGLTTADFTDGKPKLLNFFASWCVPCAAEAPQLHALKQAGVEIHAIAIRDKPADIARFLGSYGNPFARIGSDVDSNVQIALGSSGVPETFVIDGKGNIRHQHIGDIRPEHVPQLLSILEQSK